MEQEPQQNMQDFIQQNEEEDKDESLSFCDLPIHNNENNNTPKHSRCSSKSELQQDFFQFFSDQLNQENMCAAEDIISHGKLIPFNQKHPFVQTQQQKQSVSNIQESKRITNGLRKRSESLSEIKTISRTNSTSLMRSSRSLDYRKLRRSSSSVVLPEIERNSSVKSVGKSSSTAEASVKKTARPKWFVFMFGMVKFPAEMELNDIKNRQSRMNPTSFLGPSEINSGSFPVNKSSSSSSKGSWKLLKALSCKDHASVVATAPFYTSHV